MDRAGFERLNQRLADDWNAGDAVVVEFDAEGLISRWREWQHREDARSWREFVAGPAE